MSTPLPADSAMPDITMAEDLGGVAACGRARSADCGATRPRSPGR